MDPVTNSLGPYVVSQAVVPLTQTVVRLLQQKGPEMLDLAMQQGTLMLDRIGDVIKVSFGNEKLLVGMEQLSENSRRVEQVIKGVQASQIQIAQGMGALQTMSLVGMGMTGVTSAMLLMRLNLVEKYCRETLRLVKRLVVDAEVDKLARLKNGLSLLIRFEEGGRKEFGLAQDATSTCNTSANTFSQLLRSALADPKLGFPAINHYRRCLLLALLGEVRGLLIEEKAKYALDRLKDEKPVFEETSKRMFDDVLGKGPERFLEPWFSRQQVTLDVLTDVWQQARLAGAVDPASTAESPSEVFERLRGKIFRYSWRPIFSMRGKPAERELEKLKYLMACLEETNRVEAVRLRIESALQQKQSLLELESDLSRIQRNVRSADSETEQNQSFLAYVIG